MTDGFACRTCYLAGQLVEKLFSRDKARGRTDDEEKKLTLCVQLAALCHDLGHGALSHTWEAVTSSWKIQWRVSKKKLKKCLIIECKIFFTKN